LLLFNNEIFFPLFQLFLWSMDVCNERDVFLVALFVSVLLSIPSNLSSSFFLKGTTTTVVYCSIAASVFLRTKQFVYRFSCRSETKQPICLQSNVVWGVLYMKPSCDLPCLVVYWSLFRFLFGGTAVFQTSRETECFVFVSMLQNFKNR
jgi:hypothetical protein